VIEKFERNRSNLLPILHALQDSCGYVSQEAMEEVAYWLSIPASEVYGTVTFYTLFSTKPKGKYIIRLCDSPPCHLKGSDAVKQAVQKHLAVKPGETTGDGLFTLEEVSCLGLCDESPAMMVNDDIYGNLAPEKIPGILKKYGRGGSRHGCQQESSA
jgi:NADH-quinone oxidoreductase E subunit